jgi:hypothetical protein
LIELGGLYHIEARQVPTSARKVIQAESPPQGGGSETIGVEVTGHIFAKNPLAALRRAKNNPQ